MRTVHRGIFQHLAAAGIVAAVFAISPSLSWAQAGNATNNNQGQSTGNGQLQIRIQMVMKMMEEMQACMQQTGGDGMTDKTPQDQMRPLMMARMQTCMDRMKTNPNADSSPSGSSQSQTPKDN